MQKKEYIIPKWCCLSKDEHTDGMGGCWGISHGHVAKDGEDYCENCEYYEKYYNNKALCEENAALRQQVKELENIELAAKELLEVATLRGDNELPHPADDGKLWTARMQTAWVELAEALAAKEGR